MQYNGQPFRVDDFSQSGPKLLISPKYIDEMKSNPACDFNAFVHKVIRKWCNSFCLDTY